MKKEMVEMQQNAVQNQTAVMIEIGTNLLSRTAEQTRKLTEKLVTITGKTVLLTNRIEPGILGGIRLDYDGTRVDGTVSHRLEAVRSMLKNTVL